MKKLGIVTIIMSISMILVGCNNEKIINKNVASNKITIDEAKEIALNHANLTSNEVTVIRADTELDDGIEKYNIEFYHENKEYDYEINATDGSIIEYDFDVENYNLSQGQNESGASNSNSNSNASSNLNENSNTNTSSNTNTASISEEKAKEIALNHANLKSDEVTFIKSNIEVDDGIEKYNIEFYHENKEYDYEINATDGSIIEYDFDVENYNLSQNQNGTNTSNSNVNTASISEEKAKEIALNHSNLTNNQVTFGKVKLEFDDGIQKYDIEFYYNNREYSYEIDANSGNILSYEQD